MKIKNKDLETILKKLSPEEQKKVRLLRSLYKIKPFWVFPFERKRDKWDKWFDRIGFLVALIAPWALFYWMGADMAVAFLGGVAGAWTVHVIREWLQWHERNENIKTDTYSEVEDDNVKED